MSHWGTVVEIQQQQKPQKAADEHESSVEITELTEEDEIL